MLQFTTATRPSGKSKDKVAPRTLNEPCWAGVLYVLVVLVPLQLTVESSPLQFAFAFVFEDEYPGTEEEFTKLIAERNSKARMILEWKDKTVTVRFQHRFAFAGTTFEVGRSDQFTVIGCTQHYATLQPRPAGHNDSISLAFVDISFDARVGYLRLEVSAE